MNKYQEIFKKAKEEYQKADGISREILERIFPEFSESDDEKIRKAIIETVKAYGPKTANPKMFNNMLVWLEKQGPIFSDSEQRDPWEYIEKFKDLYGHYPSDADEIGVIVSEMVRKRLNKPKFKIGDWITDNKGCPYFVVGLNGKDYLVDGGNVPACGLGIDFIDDNFHLWTIKDARRGDVLVNWNDSIFIFDEIKDETVKYLIAYNETWDDRLKIPEGNSLSGWTLEQSGFKPATEEQRNILFREIRFTDYEWDGKELKKK